MKARKPLNVQQTLDSVIDKLFLWFIPSSVKPNQVTILRFVLTPVVYLLLVNKLLVAGLIVFVIAACTDFIDGAMARTRNQITDLGKIIDPIADKLLILAVLISIGLQLLIVKIFVVFIIFEIVAVILGSWFSFAIGKPMGANVFGKIKLILQAVGVSLFLLGLLTKYQLLLNYAVWILVIALVFAVAAGFETIRRKTLYLKENKIIYSQRD